MEHGGTRGTGCGEWADTDSAAASAGIAAYVGKNVAVAALEAGVESKIAGWTGDDSFSLVGSFGRNLAFNLTVGMLPGAAETKLAAKASLGAEKLATKVGLKGARNFAFGATKYAIHYSSEVAVGTAFDTAWEAGVNGRPIGQAFTQSIVGNSVGQLVGDGLSAGLRRGLQAAGIKQFGRLCFVAGTVVIRGDGGQRPIEQIELGSKVQPRDVNYVETNEPDPATWRKITLRAMNADDADVEIELLRPLSWLESQRAAIGSVVHVEIAELNLDGDARVLRIDPCPPIEPGPGAVVTGRFSHVSSDLIDVWVEGLEEPITGTSRHPFWSVTRQTWVPACKLQTGELLDTKDGRTAEVVSVGFRGDMQRVYNVEVNPCHTFRATQLGLLVHNASYQRVGANDELAQAALAHRKGLDNPLTGRNVMIAEYLDGDELVQAPFVSKGKHTERMIPEGTRLLRLFSEREPCKNCFNYIEREFPTAEVTFMFPYRDKSTRTPTHTLVSHYRKMLNIKSS